MSDFLLETKNLTVRFGGLTAVEGLDFQVKKGQIVGLIGPNGAGKTTVFNMITGVIPPTEGEIFFKGSGIVGVRPDRIARRGLSRTFQNIRLFEKISALENIVITLQREPGYSLVEAFLRTKKVREIDTEIQKRAYDYLELVGLREYADSVAGSLPYGLQRRLEIARALATEPELLLLDEPAAGMNNEECDSLIDLIRNIHEKKGITIVLIEHHMDVVVNLSDEIYVLNLGKLLAHGDPHAVQTNEDVIRAYLGQGRKNK